MFKRHYFKLKHNFRVRGLDLYIKIIIFKYCNGHYAVTDTSLTRVNEHRTATNSLEIIRAVNGTLIHVTCRMYSFVLGSRAGKVLLVHWVNLFWTCQFSYVNYV